MRYILLFLILIFAGCSTTKVKERAKEASWRKEIEGVDCVPWSLSFLSKKTDSPHDKWFFAKTLLTTKNGTWTDQAVMWWNLNYDQKLVSCFRWYDKELTVDFDANATYLWRGFIEGDSMSHAAPCKFLNTKVLLFDEVDGQPDKLGVITLTYKEFYRDTFNVWKLSD